MKGNLQQITQSLFGTDNLEEVSIEDLRQLIEDFPSFSAGHYLLSKKLETESPTEFLAETQRTALYFTNPFWLSWLLKQDGTESPELIAEGIAEERLVALEQPAPPESHLTIFDEEAIVLTNGFDPNADRTAESEITEVIAESEPHFEPAVEESKEVQETPSWSNDPAMDIPVSPENPPITEMLPVAQETNEADEAPQSLADIALAGAEPDESVHSTYFDHNSVADITHGPAERNEAVESIFNQPREENRLSDSMGAIPDPGFSETQEMAATESSSAEQLISALPDPGFADAQEMARIESSSPEQSPVEEVPIPVAISASGYSTDANPPVEEQDVEKQPLYQSGESLWSSPEAAPVESLQPNDDQQPQRAPFFWEKEFYSRNADQEKNKAQETAISQETITEDTAAISARPDQEQSLVNTDNELVSHAGQAAGDPLVSENKIIFEDNPPDFLGTHQQEKPVFGENLAAEEVKKPSGWEEHLASPPADETEELAFTPYHSIDYFASQGIFYQEENPTDKFGKQLKSFTAWLKTMKKLPKSMLATEMNELTESTIQHIAEHSIEEKEVITEAMAEVLALQGKREKAIELYEKLSLLNPSKSAYFAARIDQLKAN